jgi:lysozyme
MEINQSGITLLKSFESCKLTAYLDSVGIPTLGWGSVGSDIKLGCTWTQEQADNRLNGRLDALEHELNDNLLVSLNENQFSALICLAYNIGFTALLRSRLFSFVNNSDFEAAANQFCQWVHAGGVELPGLVRRREAEKALFQTPVEQSSDPGP